MPKIPEARVYLFLVLLSAFLWGPRGWAAGDCPFGKVVGSPGSPARTVGIEIEATLPNTVSNADLQASLAEFLRGTEGVSDVRIERKMPVQSRWARLNVRAAQALGFDLQDYVIRYQFEGRYYSFTFGFDQSIEPPKGRRGIEVRSPILRGENNLALFLKLVGRMKESGLAANPLSAGTHVHVGAADLGREQLGALVDNFGKIENGLLGFFVTHGRRMRHTKPLSDRLREGSVLRVPVEDLIARSVDRKRTLNLFSLKKLGTVEFRLFNSTVELDQLCLIANLCARFVDASATQPEALAQVISNRSAEEALPDVLRFLKLELPKDTDEVTRALLREIDRAAKERYPLLTPVAQTRLRAVGAGFAFTALGTLAEQLLLPDDDDKEKEKKSNPNEPRAEKALPGKPTK